MRKVSPQKRVLAGALLCLLLHFLVVKALHYHEPSRSSITQSSECEVSAYHNPCPVCHFILSVFVPADSCPVQVELQPNVLPVFLKVSRPQLWFTCIIYVLLPVFDFL